MKKKMKINYSHLNKKNLDFKFQITTTHICGINLINFETSF
jgi:hypothetical protein